MYFIYLKKKQSASIHIANQTFTACWIHRYIMFEKFKKNPNDAQITYFLTQYCLNYQLNRIFFFYYSFLKGIIFKNIFQVIFDVVDVVWFSKKSAPLHQTRVTCNHP